MKKITSSSNEEIKALAKLLTAQGRKDQNRFLVEGIRACSSFIESGMKPIQFYVLESLHEQALQLVPQHFITLINEQVLQKITATKTPSGLVAVFPIPAPASPDDLTSGIVLYDVSDPGNMGTLLRTCAAMNKKTAILIQGADPWNPKVVQASAGALGFLTIYQWSWRMVLDYKKNLKLCALVVKAGQKPSEIDFSNTLFMVGNEAHGIPEFIVEQCDSLMTLEMPGHIESLNVAVAGSIALYLASSK